MRSKLLIVKRFTARLTVNRENKVVIVAGVNAAYMVSGIAT